MGEAFPFGVDDDVDVALAPQRDILGDMAPGVPKTERAQHGAQILCLGLVGRELDEFDALYRDAVRHGRHLDADARLQPADAVHQEEKRAVAVNRYGAWRAAAELVVEDFQRQRAVIAGRGDRAHEAGDVEVPLAGHVAEVTAPVEQVHVDLRCVRKLDEEDAVAGDGADRRGIDVASQRVETVEDEADIRMIGTAHDLPRIAVIVDVTAPCQRLVADADAACRRPFSEFAEIVGGPVDAAKRQR